MRVYLHRLLTALLCFTIGVSSSWLTHVPEIASEPEKPSPGDAPKPINKSMASGIAGPNSPVRMHRDFKNLVITLKRLASFMGRKGRQTFHISDVQMEDGEFAYACWKEDNSILILQFPFDGEPTESDLYWLRDKARIEPQDVVPTDSDLGFYKVTKEWADDVLARCRAGYKLEFTR